MPVRPVTGGNNKRSKAGVCNLWHFLVHKPAFFSPRGREGEGGRVLIVLTWTVDPLTQRPSTKSSTFCSFQVTSSEYETSTFHCRGWGWGGGVRWGTMIILTRAVDPLTQRPSTKSPTFCSFQVTSSQYDVGRVHYTGCKIKQLFNLQFGQQNTF